MVKRIESTERLDRAKKAELRRKKEQEKEEVYVKSDKTGMKFFEFIRKATRRPEHVDALRLNGEIRHDKEGMKEAAREEFRSRFEGVNKAPKKDRRPPKDDGHLDEEVNKELTREEFDSNLKDLKNGRSGGIDGIKNELLKGSGTKTKDLLFIFIRNIFRTGYIPEDLNTGRVKLIFKSGDHLEPGNYRPITVSSVLIKLFTKIYGARLSKVLEDNNVLEDNQIGFRPGRGTADAILMINTIINKYKNKKKPLHMAFLDLTKAYDRVNREVMFEKLTEAGLGGRTRQIIQNLYYKDKILIELNGELCSKIFLTKGLKQGCGLSPTLFNFMAKEIAREVEKIDDSICLGNRRINAIFYADDLVVMASSRVKLKEKLDVIESTGGTFGMEINRKKSKRLELDDLEVLMEEREAEEQMDMERVEQFKYLGKKYIKMLFLCGSKLQTRKPWKG